MNGVVIVLLAAGTRDISKAVERLMEPYRYSFGGPPWRVYESVERIKELAVRYRTNPTNLKKIAKKLTEDSGLEFHIEDGGINYETPRNPNGQFESYQLLSGLEGNTWPVAAMPRDLVPVAVVTPDGEWHTCWPSAHWRYASEMRYAEQQEVQRRSYELIDRYPDHIAVALGCWE